MPSPITHRLPGDRRIAGVVLAAGASRRLGTPKQLLRDVDGRTLVMRAAQQLLDAGCAPVLVVTGAERAAIEAEIAPLPISVCYNAEWGEGMGGSIRCAVTWLSAWVESTGSARDALLVVACDMPSVDHAHVEALVFASADGTRRVASNYHDGAGRPIRGIPALLPSEDWPALLGLSGDRGARDLFVSPDTLTVFLRHGHFDLDTPADVARWRSDDSPQPHLPCP